MQQAVIYARVSSREQQQEGYSIPAQLKLLRDYASRIGFRIEREFVDVETAKTTGRRSFGEMVQFLRRSRGSVRTVLVEKTDRLYRNFRDAVTLEDLETEIHFVKESQVLSKNSRSQDKLTHGLHLLIARNYVENLREEVIKGMHEKAEQGVIPGRAPFGYRNNREKRSIEIHPENAEVVKFHVRALRQRAMLAYELTEGGSRALWQADDAQLPAHDPDKSGVSRHLRVGRQELSREP